MQELSQSEQEAAVKELELKLERLRVFYEQYFLGLVKREPSVQLKDCVRLLRLLDQQNIRNTALRYRLRSTTQKFNTYRTYWNRTLRQIEAGTYKRDLARAGRNLAKRGVQAPNISRARTIGEFERAVREATQASPPQSSPTQKASSPASTTREATRESIPAAARTSPASDGGVPSAEEIQSIYRRFIKAKKMCGESTHAVRIETLSQTIAKQLPRLREKHGGREIEFQVVIRAGRAVLKATPK